MMQPPLQAIILLDLGDGSWGATSFGFNQIGEYRLVIYADDFENALAQPVSVKAGGVRFFLPVVMK